ncbi:hypothetical protein F0U62_12865 [Cystobacter fuscus]|uniref:hypothetical protein n=1 Tax=Cystobacter fuscus TaxID=43 RepID=UPI002B2B69BC|nr:hypothetical protein F0U62_12865 [Cystobacter fuscus]
MFRLDSISPELAESFRHATPEHQRKATLVACTLVSSRVGLEGEEVVAALEHLRQGGKVDRELLRKLESLSARLDDEYLRLDEEDDEAKRPEVLRLFSKARAASALGFALSGDPGQLHEALYEALAAVDNATEVIRPVAEALQS